MAKDNLGAQILRQVFATRGAQARISEATDIHQSYLSKLASAVRVPTSYTVVTALHREVGIEGDWWSMPTVSGKRLLELLSKLPVSLENTGT